MIVKKEDDEHICYIQKLEPPEEEQYNHLLFFDFEATQEHGVHEPNLCVVHDEVGKWVYLRGRTPLNSFASGYLPKNIKIVSW